VTSGSTGIPRVVAVERGALALEAMNMCAALNLSARDKVFAPVSLLHSYGFDLGFLASLRAGSTIVVGRKFTTDVLREAFQSGITVFLGVPSMYEWFVRAANRDGDRACLRQLRWMLSCSSPLRQDTIVKFQDLYETVICQHYGTSETGALTNQIKDQVLRRPASVGLPLPGVKLSLVDELGHSASDRGYLVVSESGGMASGYVSDMPVNSRTRFLPDGFHTGDRAWLDDSGFVYLCESGERGLKKQNYVRR
jgi:long-chain acyl-CoA synthetase